MEIALWSNAEVPAEYVDALAQGARAAGHRLSRLATVESTGQYCQRELQRDWGTVAVLITVGALGSDRKYNAVIRRDLIDGLRADHWPQELHFGIGVLDLEQGLMETVMGLGGDEVSWGFGGAATSAEFAASIIDSVADLVKRIHEDPAPMVANADGYQMLPDAAQLRGDADSYSVIRRVGRGGTAEVYEVVSTGGDRLAAKILSPHRFELTDEMQIRFLKEIETLRAVSSGYVLRMVDQATFVDSPVLVCEYIEGSVYQRLATDPGPPLPLGLVLSWTEGALRALAALHAAGIVHRDVSPKNLLVRQDDTIVLADFGTARTLLDETITQPNEPLGSMLYVSSQQFEDPHHATPADDIFSLGQVVWHMATGRRPFGNTPPLVTMDLGVPADLSQLIVEMREHERSARPTAENALARITRVSGR